MFRMKMLCAGALITAFASCGPVEIRIDETRGVPKVAGSTEISVGTLVCGEPASAGEDTVTTKVVADGCELSYDRTVPVLKASDYASIPELSGASNLVQRVELKITKLEFIDGQTVAPLDLMTRIKSVSMAVNGQLVADKAALTALPKVISLQGDALTPLKTAIDARQPASVQVRVTVVLPNDPKPPAQLKINYDAQPAVIVGPGKIF